MQPMQPSFPMFSILFWIPSPVPTTALPGQKAPSTPMILPPELSPPFPGRSPSLQPPIPKTPTAPGLPPPALLFSPSRAQYNKKRKPLHTRFPFTFSARGLGFAENCSKKTEPAKADSVFWSECRDSNPRPLGPEPSAIPNFATPRKPNLL